MALLFVVVVSMSPVIVSTKQGFFLVVHRLAAIQTSIMVKIGPIEV